MIDFENAFERTVGIEGGYVNDPEDPGGETQWGITWPVLREAMGLSVVPGETTIRGLSRSQARAIYEELFWNRAKMGQFDPAVSAQVFDAAVNHGIGTAIRMLQRAANVADDGHLGPVSLAAIKEAKVSTVLIRFLAERLDFYTRCKAWPHDGRGWAARVVKDLRYAASDELAEVTV